MPATDTVLPPRLLGKGKPDAAVVELASPVPKIVASEPGATRGPYAAESVMSLTTGTPAAARPGSSSHIKLSDEVAGDQGFMNGVKGL